MTLFYLEKFRCSKLGNSSKLQHSMPDELLVLLAALGYPNANRISDDKYKQTN